MGYNRLTNSYICHANVKGMEDWQLDFEWLRAKHFVKNTFDRKDLPDINAILLLLGIQELGQIRTSFTKEEKQDLMHIAVCSLLSQDGYYTFKGQDADGWPHWEQQRKIDLKGPKAQERYLKELIIKYFNLQEEE